ncbi:MAG: hypothetical protein ACYTGC_10760 [Planctomycetota bacterium]|jgi:hypothetical protein
MLRSTLTIIVLTCCALVLAACESTQESEEPASQPEASLGVLNDTCPVMGGAVDENTTVAYEGYEIGLCCAGCVGKWDEMSDSEKQAFVSQYTKK